MAHLQLTIFFFVTFLATSYIVLHRLAGRELKKVTTLSTSVSWNH